MLQLYIHTLIYLPLASGKRGRSGHIPPAKPTIKTSMDHKVEGTNTELADGRNGHADRITNPSSQTIMGIPAIARFFVHNIAVREITELNQPAKIIVHGSGQLVPPTVNRVPR